MKHQDHRCGKCGEWLNIDRGCDACEVIALAKRVATEAHAGQFRRDGVTPYVTHPETVAAMVSHEAKPVAWLHDVLEDCAGYTLLRLFEIGFPAHVIEAVDLLTKVPGEDYFEYIDRVKSNPLAREVKIADITHNLSANPKPDAVPKYQKALEMLNSGI